MTLVVQIRGGAVAGLPTLAARELGVTTDIKRLYVGDGAANHILGVKHNIAGTTAPTANEDAGDGYSVGSIWIDTTNDKGYVCVDSTTTAAVWQQFSGTGAGGGGTVTSVTATAPLASSGGTTPNITLGASALTGYIYGFQVQYNDTYKVTVGYPNANGPTSICRDKADAAFITLAAGTTYVTHNDTLGGPQENDSFTGPGTVGVTNASATVTGSSTTFLTSFGTRTGTGTYSTSGTTATGSSTKWLTELAVNDLIGDDTNGYSLVTAIASDTSCTLTAALPNGNASAGTAFKIIEQPTIYVVDKAVCYHVKTIASNTSLTVTTNYVGTDGSSAYYVGYCAIDVAPPAGATWNYVWVSKGGTGTTAFVSTQRTTPFGYGDFGIAATSSELNGYLTSVRRIGVVRIKAGGDILGFKQNGSGVERWYWTYANNADQRPLSAGTSTSFANVACNGFVPPPARQILGAAFNGAAANYIGLQPRPNFTTGTTSTGANLGMLNGFTALPFNVFCDETQTIQYVVNTGQAGFEVYGYMESLA